MNWNNGSNLRVSSILPANLECWYAPTPRLELGLLLNVEGNQYHGDPDIYQVDNPLLRYSVGTFGPSINYRISQGLTVGASASNDAGSLHSRQRFALAVDFSGCVWGRLSSVPGDNLPRHAEFVICNYTIDTFGTPGNLA